MLVDAGTRLCANANKRTPMGEHNMKKHDGTVGTAESVRYGSSCCTAVVGSYSSLPSACYAWIFKAKCIRGEWLSSLSQT